MKIIPVDKLENYYQKDYRIGENRLVTVNINKPNVLFPNLEIKINWSCIGSVSIEKAEQFLKELRKAIGIAKKERKQYDKNK